MLRTNGTKSKTEIIPQELLDDIASRFLLDAPDTELKDPISLCFLTELAYWFYLDEYVEEDDSLTTLKFDSFALQLLQHVKINPLVGTLEDMLQDFRDFKHKVPTYGAMILSSDLDQVLLVQGFWHRASWGFPKGKINVEEEPYECAIREVLEETGYDISRKINKDIFIETAIGEQKVRLYIIPSVSMSTEFVPRTKGEIKELKWFPISQLPSYKNDRNYSKTTGPTNMFYMVMPFVKPLREWVANRTRSGSVPNEKVSTGREVRKRHRSLNSNSESGQRNLQNSPCPPGAAAETPKSKCQHGSSTSLTEGLKPCDSSPRKKESKSKSKGKKNNFPADISTEEHSQQKFSFKSRGKSKGGNHTTSNTNSANSSANGSNNRGMAAESDLVLSVHGFRSYSWQNFRINKRAINEALDKAWSGVTLRVKV